MEGPKLCRGECRGNCSMLPQVMAVGRRPECAGDAWHNHDGL